MKITSTVTCLALLLAVPALARTGQQFTRSAAPATREAGAVASSLTGTWKGETPNGMQITLVLTATDTALTGTLDRNGEVSKLSEGTVVKNTFSFKATLGGETETIEGTWENDEAKAWLARQGPERTVVLKRVK